MLHANLYYFIFFIEFAENGSIYDYIHEQHKQPSLSQIILWSTQVAEGILLRVAGQSKLIQM